MDIEALVATITRAVLREIASPPDGPRLLVFARQGDTLPARLGAFLAGRSWSLYAGEEVSDTARCILPCLHIDQMVDLALGKGGSRLMHGVRSALLRGCRVEVVELEYVKFRDTAPPRLFSLYESYWRTLRGFGLATFRDAVEPAEQKGKRVLTERDVLGAHGSGAPRIEVTASCRVTPLARERAGLLGVEIIRQTGGRG